MKLIISNNVSLPIYEQIVNQIRDSVIAGELQPGESLPSIRTLAKDIEVSVITTKRAYEELEKEGVVESIPGKGFYVKEQKNDYLREVQMKGLEARYMELIKDSKNAGMKCEDIVGMIEVLYEEME